MKKLMIWLGLVLLMPLLWGQSTDLYLVYFEKKSAPSPEAGYLSLAAQQRRVRQGLPACDWYDLPVDLRYVAQVAPRVDSLRYVLRWFNAVSVTATPEQAQGLRHLPGVCHVEKLGRTESTLAAGPALAAPTRNFDTLLAMQRNLMELDTLLHRRLSGRGVRIAIFDAGFKGADTHPALALSQVQATRDFYGGDSSVYHHAWHGTEVMSCIAGYYEDRQLGAAPDAEFLLARVEHKWWEPQREEDHWMAAAEWAEKEGADLIHSSLGFLKRGYAYGPGGRSLSPVSQAARIATEKGVLVINSMGNQGLEQPAAIGAPAEVPEVLSVGGSLPMLRERIPFSTPGPNVAGFTKPDVAAPGFVLGPKRKGAYTELAGTSYAAPLITGVAACLLQAEPGLNPADLHARLREAGHFYPYYDYELGYGVVQASRLFSDSESPARSTFRLALRSDSVILAFDSLTMVQDSVSHPYGRMLYYQLMDEQGRILAAQAVRIPNQARYYYFLRRRDVRGWIRVWFEGYLFEKLVEEK